MRYHFFIRVRLNEEQLAAAGMLADAARMTVEELLEEGAVGPLRRFMRVLKVQEELCKKTESSIEPWEEGGPA